MGGELIIKDLRAQIGDTEILKGINLTIRQGETHALMGKNGSGKSTLANVLMGDPKYDVTGGEVLINGENILELEPDERAKRGLFLAFQYPSSIPGVPMFSFLRASYNAVHPQPSGKPMAVREFRKLVTEKLTLLKMDEEFLKRYLNDGFSGGEKKRAEILQMALLTPRFAVLDETDSGLDIDALRIVADGVNAQRGTNLGALVITHYQRLLDYIVPDHVHVMLAGRIVTSGDKSLALDLESKGYDWVEKEFGSGEAA